MGDPELAWAAGLFEGEGSFTINRSNGGRYSYPWAVLAMSDRDVVEKFASIMECGNIQIENRTKRAAHHKTLYRWSAKSRADFEQAASLLEPRLGQRRSEQLTRVREQASPPRHLCR